LYYEGDEELLANNDDRNDFAAPRDTCEAMNNEKWNR
jgi:hypothetical protein